MASKHDKVVILSEGVSPMNSHNPLNMWSGGSCDKLKTYLHYHNAYDHKTYQGGDIQRGSSTHKFAWPFNEVVMWGHVAN